MELDVLKGMMGTIRECKPELFIELHGANHEQKSKNAATVIEFVGRLGYSVYHVETNYHVETKSQENLVSDAVIKEGHLYCTPQSYVS